MGAFWLEWAPEWAQFRKARAPPRESRDIFFVAKTGGAGGLGEELAEPERGSQVPGSIGYGSAGFGALRGFIDEFEELLAHRSN